VSARIGVFCGSSFGRDPAFAAAAHALGERIAARGLGLVYGGGNVGLMGVVADAVLAAGGEVIGVIPRALVEREVAHAKLSELVVVNTLAERKEEMIARADAFVSLPGGTGTLDELFEVLTWTQLGYLAKPSGLLDVARYYAPLLAFLDGAVAQGFLRPEHRALLITDTDADRLLGTLVKKLS
jgi:hypothetical protein